MPPALEIRVKRARARAWRRGFREADLILGPFADTHVPGMGVEQLSQFEALLEQNDHDVYDWVVGTTPAPAEFDNEVLAALRARAWSGPAGSNGG